ncbi:MAG TPA: hypothetical protein VFU37_02255, partial [Pyrinomonadaceae bacterium]|nr:hypothetical protein [Pyrinomonadaceae bacterium]
MRKSKLIAGEAQAVLKSRFWFLLIVSSVISAGFVVTSKSGVTATSEGLNVSRSSSEALETKTAEQVYKNIQVFKGLPASELEPTMAFISGSLGVKCNH